MLKFMAWERSFEKRVMQIREKELRFQRRNYMLEILFIFIWLAPPLDLAPVCGLTGVSFQGGLAYSRHPSFVLALCSRSEDASYTFHRIHLCKLQ